MIWCSFLLVQALSSERIKNKFIDFTLQLNLLDAKNIEGVLDYAGIRWKCPRSPFLSPLGVNLLKGEATTVNINEIHKWIENGNHNYLK